MTSDFISGVTWFKSRLGALGGGGGVAFQLAFLGCCQGSKPVFMSFGDPSVNFQT